MFEEKHIIVILRNCHVNCLTSNLPNSMIPTKIARLRRSGKFPMGLGIPPLQFKIMLESSPLKSIILELIHAAKPDLTEYFLRDGGNIIQNSRRMFAGLGLRLENCATKQTLKQAI